MKKLLAMRFLNGWELFWLISLPMCSFMLWESANADLSTGPGVSTMIGYSVRWAVPFIYLVVATSAVRTLFPGEFGNYWLRNRKYFGFCFAVAMFWQGIFIFIMSNYYSDFYNNDVYLLRDELEGSVGYIFLVFMVLTSSKFGRSCVSRKQWNLLHTSGICFLWAYPFSVYWWNLYYYEQQTPIDYVFYWCGFTAFALRIVAWGKRRAQVLSTGNIQSPIGARLAGVVAVGSGLIASATGRHWQDAVTTFLTAPEWSAELVLWLPFWPLEPFLPLLLMGLGALLLTLQPRSAELAVSSNIHA